MLIDACLKEISRNCNHRTYISFSRENIAYEDHKPSANKELDPAKFPNTDQSSKLKTVFAL